MIASGTSVAVTSRPASRARSWLLLAVLLLALSAVIAVWLSIDRRPQQWDHANHLKRAVDCYRTLSEPGHDRLKEILETSSFYPPIAPCAAGVLYFVFPIVPLTAQSVMLAFLALGVASTFALGRRLLDEPAGLLAAFFIATAPFVEQESRGERSEREQERDRAQQPGGGARRRAAHFPVQTVPAGFSIGTPTALPYSVQEPS